ncbi:MAG: type IX secretion system membrane protein PorP/SprF [Saprospiraceae bacterium]|nr:type IX secretion system membrane protein PorP/SprF [Saprospiraceae bacterium]
MMPRIKILLFSICIFLSWNFTSYGQSSFFSAGGAHTLSLANTGTMYDGISSIYTNPAGLVSIENFAFDVGYNQRYNLSELSTVSLGGAKNFGSGVFGLSVSRYGYSAYSESKIGLVYARKLFSNLSIGAGFNMLNYTIDQFGSSNSFTFEIGMQSQINKKLSIGAYVFSPEVVSLTDETEIASRFSLGVKYKMSSKADLYVDISKTINRDPEFKFAVDYRLVEAVSVRFGGNVTQESIHFGPAYKMNNGLGIYGGYAYDNRIGHSVGISLTYSSN